MTGPLVGIRKAVLALTACWGVIPLAPAPCAALVSPAPSSRVAPLYHTAGWETSAPETLFPAAGPEPFEPESPFQAATAMGLPTLAGAFVVAALRRGRRGTGSTCPDCGSNDTADVGRVGAYRRSRRCHACGSLWAPSEFA